MDIVSWNGTILEQAALLSAVEHNCKYRFSDAGLRTGSCLRHEMLVHDHRALNGLLWNRRLLERLLEEKASTRHEPAVTHHFAR